MEWTKYYQEHTLTPEQAVGLIHDGDRVVFGHAVGEPIIFQRTMAEMAEQFHDVEVAHMVYLGSGEYLQPGMESHFRHNALFVGGPARKAIAEHRADYTPVFFSDVPRMFRDGTLPIDVFAFTCSPPDERGYVSLGLSCDYSLQAVKSAKTVIAEINPNMPRRLPVRMGAAARVQTAGHRRGRPRHRQICCRPDPGRRLPAAWYRRCAGRGMLVPRRQKGSRSAHRDDLGRRASAA